MRYALTAPVRRFALVLAATGGLLLLPTATPAAAAEITVSVTHPATATKLVTPGSDGHRIGDVRVGSLVVTDEQGAPGRLDAILTTTGIDVPEPGLETRIGELAFTFADGSQIFVAGAATYPGKGTTLAIDTTTVRPIIGGTGRFRGAAGWCDSIHRPDGSWEHVFHLTAGGSPG